MAGAVVWYHICLKSLYSKILGLLAAYNRKGGALLSYPNPRA